MLAHAGRPSFSKPNRLTFSSLILNDYQALPKFFLSLLPSSLAMFNIAVAVSIALLLSCRLPGASAVPFERRADGLITQCTTPNTVALTFVRRPCLPPQCSTLPPLSTRLTSNFFLLFQDDGPYKYMYDNSSCRNCCAIRLILYFREDIVKTLDSANAKGTFFFSS
jgi:hypothetical protein